MANGVAIVMATWQWVYLTLAAVPIPYSRRVFDILLLCWGSILRFGAGLAVAKGIRNSKHPKIPLKLYEFEGCPFCKKVRETMSELDLDAEIYPCPRETLTQYGYCKDSRFRPVVKKKGGRLAFPYLIDDNTGTAMYESDDIIKYLWEEYGNGAERRWNVNAVNQNKAVQMLTLGLSTMTRPAPEHGLLRIPSKVPKKPLELWSFEASPYCRLAREALCSLELPYILHNIAKGSAKRKDFIRQHGKVQVPFLKDPNTGVEMFESSDIVAYLFKTYADGPIPKESFLSYSTKGKIEAKTN
eukprot:Clim_evm10s51 gene=Clim_evmTU10s51